MASFVDALANALPDLAILAVAAFAFAAFGAAVAWTSHRVWFRRWRQHAAYEDKLADTAHSSLLGLSAFVLALMITNGLASLGRAEVNVRQEAASIHRLARELDSLGPAAEAARTTLASYVQDVAGDEWRRLATAPNALSPLAGRDLDTLWADLRALQKSMDPTDARRVDVIRYADQIETRRQSRLADSTSDIPGVFWLILIAFVALASFLAGREAPMRFGMQVSVIHMAAIGLAAGLVVILYNPFRGETSIAPDIILGALGP